MHQASFPKPGSETPESEKVPFLLVRRIREAILDETLRPADRLVEVELAEKFAVSRQPVREERYANRSHCIQHLL
jgi:DNA-binding GntR family transcriptional regulator